MPRRFCYHLQSALATRLEHGWPSGSVDPPSPEQRRVTFCDAHVERPPRENSRRDARLVGSGRAKLGSRTIGLLKCLWGKEDLPARGQDPAHPRHSFSLLTAQGQKLKSVPQPIAITHDRPYPQRHRRQWQGQFHPHHFSRLNPRRQRRADPIGTHFIRAPPHGELLALSQHIHRNPHVQRKTRKPPPHSRTRPGRSSAHSDPLESRRRCSPVFLFALCGISLRS